MIRHNTFSYLKANTVLFAQKMCESLGDMCGAQFSPLKETIREGAYSSPFSVMLFVNFTGAIQGYYLLSFNETVAIRLIGAWEDGMTPDRIRDLREEFSGLLKEALNLAVGQAIEELEKSFTNLTFTPSTVVYGEIEFPNILCGSIDIEGREGKMLCGFSLNLANLKIGEKLEETLKELEKQTMQANESRRNIDSILALLPTGLLAINSDGIIQPGFSNATTTIVGHGTDTEVAGSFLWEFIGTPDSEHAAWKNWLSLSFDKFNQLPFSDIKALCPAREFTNRFGRILKLDWYPKTDDTEEHLDKLLVTIEDVTRQRELERKMLELNIRHQENLNLISQVINLQPDEITDFIYDSSELLGKAKKIVESNNIDREFINELFRTFHTLKGRSGQYQFKSLQELSLKVENHLKLFRDNKDPVTEDSIDEIKNSIDDARGFIDRIQNVQTKLGGKTESIRHKALRDPQTVMAPIHEIDAAAAQLVPIIDKCKNDRLFFELEADLVQVRNKILELRTITLSFFMSSFDSLLENACKKTGKKASISTCHDIKTDIVIMRKLHQCFIHLINNAIDHGIESPELRTSLGKIETGMITISGSLEGAQLHITVEDDGKGIDSEVIRSRLQNSYNYSREEISTMTDTTLFSFLLKPGFSTKTETTEISGRGTGMDFVNHTISQLGGSVIIKSVPGKGTAITMVLPQN